MGVGLREVLKGGEMKIQVFDCDGMLRGVGFKVIDIKGKNP